MSYSKGLSYKPLMDRSAAETFTAGGLVHMLEFSVNSQTFGGKDFLGNFTKAMGGKNAGPISDFAMRHMSFNEQENSFMGLASTSVKEGFPFELFTDRTNVGVLINPVENSSFFYISGCDVFSHSHDEKHVAMAPEFFIGVNSQKLLEINFGKDGSDKTGNLVVPLKRSKEDEQALRNYFYKDLFNIYSKGLDPQDDYFVSKFRGASQHSFNATNEIGINFQPSCVKALVIYSSDTSMRKPGYEPVVYKNKHTIEGANLAYLLNEMIKKETGKGLPVIHYHMQGALIDKEILSFTGIGDNGKNTSKPIIREATLEPRKVADAIRKDDFTRKVFERYLSKEYVTNLLLNKVQSEVAI